MRKLKPTLFPLAAILLFTCAATAADKDNTMSRHEPIKVTDHIRTVINHPAFEGFGEHLLARPQDAFKDITMEDIGGTMPWHDHVVPEVVVSGLNRLIADVNEGRTVFYSFYSDAEKRADTGLFFLRGRPGAPFAILCPGGGFSYIGSMHEGFPMADEINKHGYNAFVLEYRTGGEGIACSDLAAALVWIFAHAKELGVGTEGYSVWGGSAGGRMSANMGSLGPAYYGAKSVPKPAAVIVAYTGHEKSTPDDSPAFSIVSQDDPIAGPGSLQRRTETLRKNGIDAEFVLLSNAGHGFGTGKGTEAEGWMEKAIAFWERHIPMGARQ